MSVHASITSLLSRDESRSASASLLVLGVILGGSAVSAAFWLRSEGALRWLGRRSHRSVTDSRTRPDRHVVCVLDGLSKSCRSDAIEVATCFGITEIWVVANADASDLRDDFKQTHNGSVFSANGLTVTMRIFANAQECCAELIDAGWTIRVASSEFTEAESLLSGNKVAVVAAAPFPSTAFLQAASHEASAGQGKLPAAAALALTLHHCTANTHAQAAHQQQSSRPEAKEGPGHLAADSNDLLKDSDEIEEQSVQESQSKQDAAAAFADQAAAPENSSTLPPRSGAAEADASGSLDTSSAPSSASDSDFSSSHANNSKADDSTPAEPQTGGESAIVDVQQGASAMGGDGSQLSQPAQSNQATSPETGSNTSSPVARSSGLAGMSAGADSSNGQHDDDDARSMRSQDTTTSRASKIQASEMSRLQAQAMRRSGVMRRHGMGGPGGSRPTSSMGSPTGSVASVSTSGWPETSPYK